MNWIQTISSGLAQVKKVSKDYIINDPFLRGSNYWGTWFSISDAKFIVVELCKFPIIL